MKKLEILFWVIGLASIIMRFNFITGSTWLLLIAFLGLAIVYFPFILSSTKLIAKKVTPLEADKSEREKYNILFSISGIGFSAICVGVLFKLINLPGGNADLIVGIVLSLLAIIYLLIKRNAVARVVTKMLLRNIAIGAIGLAFLSIPTIELIKFQYRNYPSIVTLYEQIQKDPNNEELNLKFEIETNKISMTEEEFNDYMDYINNREVE